MSLLPRAIFFLANDLLHNLVDFPLSLGHLVVDGFISSSIGLFDLDSCEFIDVLDLFIGVFYAFSDFVADFPRHLTFLLDLHGFHLCLALQFRFLHLVEISFASNTSTRLIN